jgi:hypothetical protein
MIQQGEDAVLAHKVKMRVKANLRAQRYERQKDDAVYVPANLGVNHPDHGMNWAEHQAEKQARQKSS